VVKYAIASLLALAGLSAAPGTQSFVGVISDDMCWSVGHARMRMGPTDAECAKACVAAHGAAYVLVVKTSVYTLSDEKAAERFAGQKVRVVGVLDTKTKTIGVKSIVAQK